MRSTSSFFKSEYEKEQGIVGKLSNDQKMDDNFDNISDAEAEEVSKLSPELKAEIDTLRNGLADLFVQYAEYLRTDKSDSQDQARASIDLLQKHYAIGSTTLSFIKARSKEIPEYLPQVLARFKNIDRPVEQQESVKLQEVVFASLADFNVVSNRGDCGVNSVGF